ncbi:MAG TPA: hypothetical protein VM536_00865, partial [Chloroflexia bacterium]|nr:hypothetical protein [Chloroflexia bacterium]
FSQRGAFRRGLPRFGRSDSEHGWPQVIPASELLHSGQVVVDWQTGRAAAVDAWRITSVDRPAPYQLRLGLAPLAAHSQAGGLAVFLKVLRVPAEAQLAVTAGPAGRPAVLSAAQSQRGHLLAMPDGEGTVVSLTLGRPTD